MQRVPLAVFGVALVTSFWLNAAENQIAPWNMYETPMPWSLPIVMVTGAFWLALVTRRFLSYTGAHFVYAAGVVLGLATCQYVFGLHAGLPRVDPLWIILLGGVVGIGILQAGLGLVAWPLVWWLGFRQRPKKLTTCLYCGYDIGIPSAERCPECGWSTSTAPVRWRRLSWLFAPGRHPILLLVIGFVPILILALSMRLTVGVRVDHFCQLLGVTKQQCWTGDTMYDRSTGPLSVRPTIVAVWRYPDGAGRALDVQYSPWAQGDEIAMIVFYGALGPPQPMMLESPTTGTPIIGARLTQSEALALMRTGSMDAIAARFAKEAAEQGWSSASQPYRVVGIDLRGTPPPIKEDQAENIQEE